MKITTNGTPGAKVTKLQLSKETVRNLRVRADVRTGTAGVGFGTSVLGTGEGKNGGGGGGDGNQGTIGLKTGACPLTQPGGP